jgi:hypothetical protein
MGGASDDQQPCKALLQTDYALYLVWVSVLL